MAEKARTSVYKYGNDVVWSLPCLFQYEPVFGYFQQNLEAAGFEPLKANIFGSPATAWSGGRAPLVVSELSKEKLTRLFDYIQNLYHGAPTFTFSRIDITKDDLKDKYANYLLDFALERNARFIVSSDILRDYIKKKNSKAKVVGSILKAIYRFQGTGKIEEPTVEAETEFYNKLLKEYDYVVVRPEYSKTVLVKKPELIKDISRVEVLINQLCISNCPNAPLHGSILADLHKDPNKPSDKRMFCYKNKYSLKQQYGMNSAHTPNEVKKLIKAGVRQLKLQGRGEPVPYFENAMLLASQMFNMEGPNLFMINIHTMMAETDRFYSIVDNEKQWYYKEAFAGFHRV